MKSKNLWIGLLMMTFSAALGCARANDSEVLGTWFHEERDGSSSATITFYADGRFNQESEWRTWRGTWITATTTGTFAARNGRMTLTIVDGTAHSRLTFPDGTQREGLVLTMVEGEQISTYRGEVVTITYAVGGNTLRLDWRRYGDFGFTESQTFQRW
ncbi:MAG: hypothetical protein FWB82_04145 [Treponema sp.]|nr:hypothetical protein [Treponema sp.]